MRDVLQGRELNTQMENALERVMNGLNKKRKFHISKLLRDHSIKMAIKRLKNFNHGASFDEDAFESGLNKVLSYEYGVRDPCSLDQLIIRLLHGRRMVPHGSLENAMRKIIKYKRSVVPSDDTDRKLLLQRIRDAVDKVARGKRNTFKDKIVASVLKFDRRIKPYSEKEAWEFLQLLGNVKPTSSVMRAYILLLKCQSVSLSDVLK